MTSSPRVTVGFTTYNVERYLPLAFDSVLAQDLTDYEVVVCDNGSTDRTWDICRAYAARDGRFRIFRNPTNLGVSGSFARVVSLARGDLFKYTFHDDLSAPTLLSTCVRTLDEAGPAAVLAYPLTMYIDDNGDELGPWDDAVELRDRASWRRVGRYAMGWNLCGELTGVIRLDALRRTGLLRPMLSSDVAMLVELAALGQFLAVPRRLYRCRHHVNSTYQGNHDPDDLLALLEPTVTTAPGGPRRRAKPVPHHAGLTGVAVRALLGLDLPWQARASCAAAYTAGWTLRRVRVRAGRWRHQITGRPLPRAPWDQAAAEDAPATPSR